MDELFSSSARRVRHLLAVLLCFFFTGSLSAQPNPPLVEFTGEISVVIFDDRQADRSEIRYYVIDDQNRQETELFFNGAVPDSVATGNRAAFRGQLLPNGLDVLSLTPIDQAEPDSSMAEAGPPAPETRKILTLLVDFNDATVDGPGMDNGVTLQEAKDTMYNDIQSVAGLYFNASLGTFTLDPDGDGDLIQDVFGPYQIDDSYIGGIEAQCTPSTWVTLASDAWEAANPGKEINIYRHRLLIVPNYWDWANRHCGWGGVAQLGCGTWCWALSADPDVIQFGTIIHELGHNFSFNHARTDPDNDGYDDEVDSEYGDTSDLMGSSRSWMKFNAPHAEDQDWISADYELRDVVPDTSPQQFSLIPMDEEVWDMPGLRALKIQRTATSSYYVSYRSQSGDYNDVNTEYVDKINIHYGFNNNTYSYFVRTLAPGESFVDEATGLRISANSGSTVTVLLDSQPCYPLTLNHSGAGTDPNPTPANSSGCAAGSYLADELIDLTASPANGWSVGSWTGSNDDASTSTSNQLTMPASAAAVSVNYVEIPPSCFALARSHTGQGTNPNATPANSGGCTAGSYIAGELINLTASPANGWSVESWTGSNDDGSTSTSNQLTMPASAAAVSVNYIELPPSCFTLVRSHTGQGTNPNPTPANSSGCAAGSYIAGELINLTASPANGWSVESWTGSNDDGSTSTSNQLTMPDSAAAVSVNYAELPPSCFTLVRSHAGEGSDPVASPLNSGGCDLGSYNAGEVIDLIATPDTDWNVVGWVGTNDDSSSSTSNQMTMPAKATAVFVSYGQAPPDCHLLSISHSGEGTDPVASPSSSTNCDNSSYLAGEVINLTATPDNGWRIDSWAGTDNDASTLPSNQLTMPDNASSVSVSYVFGPEPGSGETFFVPVEPCRISDSRIVGGPFAAEEVRDFRAWGDGLAEQGGTDDCGVPASAVAVHLNFTVVNPGGFGYLRAWPLGEDEPLATLMAFTAGPGISNATALAICNTCPSDFHVKVYGSTTDLVTEVVGYYQYVSSATAVE